MNFPENTGRDGTTLDIWAIEAETGARVGAEPHASFEIDATGGFGPVTLESGAHYEYVLATADGETRHHLCLQPYVRGSHLVRLRPFVARGAQDARVVRARRPGPRG